jgi:ADP-ribosylglycohydrolase
LDSAPDLQRGRLSLDGLSIGDAFGELFFTISPSSAGPTNLPPGPWRWTDDTHMALSVMEVLERFGRIEQDALAHAFARRFAAEPYRGYGSGAMKLLSQLADGADWRTAAPALFGGGSYGNGAAMRAAPIGGCFWRDPARAAAEAQKSAIITHAHPEGQAGAMAVAAAAALAAQPAPPGGAAFLRAVLRFVPPGLTRRAIEQSADLPGDDLTRAVRVLGTGDNVSAQDTVPFCLWSAAYHLRDFEGALWWTVSGLGDRDTTCAIVGGVVALASGELPSSWLQCREELPAWHP